MKTALAGTKVLELCNMIAGPFCTKIMADYGADVIKVERPGLGDTCRSVGPFLNDEPHPDKCGLFLYLNSNKRSITLDLTNATGVKIFGELLKQSDVIVESLGAREMTSLGLDYGTLKKISPNLVMTSISNFGQTGPYSDYRATDLNVWALSGILYECGEADREPLRIGDNQTEYVAGLYALLATLSALHYRDATSVGQQLDVSACEAFHTTEPYMTLMCSAMGGFIRKRAGNHWPWGILPCQDGYVGFFFPTQTHWESLCALMGMPELREKPEYETPMMRDERREEITAIIVSWLKGKRMEEVFHAAQEYRLPLSHVPNIGQILDMPQHKDREYFVEIEHPVAGKLTYPGALFRLSETPWQAGRAPLLGEHNQEIYCGRLGHSREDLVKLRATGII